MSSNVKDSVNAKGIIASMAKANRTVSDYAQLFLSNVPMIDVRAPQEYTEACAPGAVCIPLLDDQQRHLVGVEYKRTGKDAAIALGARLLDEQQRARRVAHWSQFVDANPGAVIYCARGGMRSNIASGLLGLTGDKSLSLPVVEGGYKALRRFLIQSLSDNVQRLPLVVVGGRTGIGKTHFLNSLERPLDLEGLAKHRGSSFGATTAAQPGNANFENQISVAMLRLASNDLTTVFVEDEARLIGSNTVPIVLHDKMKASPMIILEETLEARIDNVISDYVEQLLPLYTEKLGEQAGFEAYSEQHLNNLYRVRKRFGGENYAAALELGKAALLQHKNNNDTSAYKPLVEMLLVKYYDPMYDYQLKAKEDRVVQRGNKHELAQWCGDATQLDQLASCPA